MCDKVQIKEEELVNMAAEHNFEHFRYEIAHFRNDFLRKALV